MDTGKAAANDADFGGAKEIVSFDTQAVLTQQVADLRATLTGSAKTSGNVGVAQIDIPGIQPTMAASSRIGVTTADQQVLGFVGQVPETFPSTVVPTGSNPPQMLNRAADSQAKILNNIAAQLGDNTSVMGNINLLTERFVELTKEAPSIESFTKYIPFVETQRIEGGVDILDYKSRVRFGCKSLGYSASQGCAP